MRSSKIGHPIRRQRCNSKNNHVIEHVLSVMHKLYFRPILALGKRERPVGL
jgi:hypothetical protein